jgi:PKD repeat protein
MMVSMVNVIVLLLVSSCLDTAPNVPPIAQFQATTVDWYAPASVSFDASGSVDSDGQITAYDWAFGDGGTATGETAVHTYSSAGTYTITLRVCDNDGEWGEATQDIVALVPPAPQNNPPVAQFTFTPQSPSAGEQVTFSAASSYDPAAMRPKSITSYSWSFGDGQNGTGTTTTHAYAATGDYQVTLVVTDNEGAQASVQQVIHIAAAAQKPPVAAFTFTPQEPTIVQEVTFTAEGSYDPASVKPKSITAYAWNFGDGETGTGEITTHRYTAEGDFTVTLSVTDNDGATGNVQHTVSIGPPAPPPPPG